MKKLISVAMALVMLGAFSMGCAGKYQGESKVKCPKCGAVFTIDEGLKSIGGGN